MILAVRVSMIVCVVMVVMMVMVSMVMPMPMPMGVVVAFLLRLGPFDPGFPFTAAAYRTHQISSISLRRRSSPPVTIKR